MAPGKFDKKGFEDQLEKALVGFAIELTETMANKAPADTGELRASIRNGWDVKRRGSVFIVEMSMAPHAPFVEFGTRPHEILPKKSGGVLRFESGKKARLERRGKSREGKIVYTKRVMHPGTTAQPFIRPTFHQDMVPLLRKNLKRRFK